MKAFLESLCVEAVGAFQSPAVDEAVRSTVAEALRSATGDALLRFLTEAYERGYREGLASGAPAAAASAPPPPPEEVPVAPVDWGAPAIDEPDDSDDADADAAGDDDDGADAEPAAVARPIAANATVATLGKRIVQTFDLERFDIDVIICRKGDVARRRLKASTRLTTYRRTDG